MTIPKDCKRLAEVDFPIAEVSKHAAREKSIRHGHPSTLHLWWARRPLASSRAVLLALLLPDPVDPLCPPEFKVEARELLSQVQYVGKNDADLRAALLKFIGDFANWDLASNQQYLNVSRGLVRAAHPDETPLVVDPFAGGGSIPLEALRLGCDAFASDLNPVAGLIQKVMLDDIPRYGRAKIKVHTEQGEVEADGLAAALRLAGAEIKKAAEKELAQFYPPDADGARPIAYLWARTVRCESPNCGAEIPLLRSFWLSKRASHRRALRPKIIRDLGVPPRIEFEIFSPNHETEVQGRTVKRANATCICCQTTLPAERVRTQLSSQRGGAEITFDKQGERIGGALPLAVLVSRPNQNGRDYRLPSAADIKSLFFAQEYLNNIKGHYLSNGLSCIPDEEIPLTEIRRISVPLYGCAKWEDVFTPRQKIALFVLSEKARQTSQSFAEPYRYAVTRLLALSVSKQGERLSSFVSWITQTDAPRGTFARQALGFVWDFAELVPIVEEQEYPQLINAMATVIEEQNSIIRSGAVESADACYPPLPEQSIQVWFTDPPYYDSVPYAHLSDFFYVWLKRIIPPNSGFDASLTPKEQECVVDRPHTLNPSAKDEFFYENKMAKAMFAGKSLLTSTGIGCVVFAHKTTEGWESLLGGMLRGGFVIKASWPIQTERGARLNAQEQAALATSVHLICRPRSENAEVGDWTQVSRELPRKVGDWMQRLQSEGIRGADLVFACIGPALEIYSRYSKVVDAEDREIPLGGDPEAREPHLRGYLVYVWETVGRLALEQVLGTSDAQRDATNALEEDARLTALFLWTQGSASPQVEKLKGNAPELEEVEADDEDAPKKKSKGGFALPFDVVRRFAQPLGIHLPEWENRIIDTDKGVVTLLSVKDRARQLFGEDGASAFASEIEDNPFKPAQMTLFPETESAPKVRGRRKSKKEAEISFEQRREATTLDRLHAAMLLQKGGQTTALRNLLQSEVERSPDFMKLANALSALYPRESEEKRLLDALLVNVRR